MQTGEDQLMASGRRPWSRRRFSQRGGTTIEMALVAPVVLMIVFGLIDYGLLFKDWLAVTQASRSGARAGSVAGRDAASDFDILTEAKRYTGALPDGALKRVVVFKAESVDGEPSDTCKAGTPATEVFAVDPVSYDAPVATGEPCNVYTAADMNRSKADFERDSGPHMFWPANERTISRSAPPDLLGVYLVIEHDMMTGFFGSSRTIEVTTVMRLEPGER